MTQLVINGALCFKEMAKSHTNLEFVTKSNLTLVQKEVQLPTGKALALGIFAYFLGRAITNYVCSQE